MVRNKPRHKGQRGRPPKVTSPTRLENGLKWRMNRLIDHSRLDAAEIGERLGLFDIGVNFDTLRKYAAKRRKAQGRTGDGQEAGASGTDDPRVPVVVAVVPVSTIGRIMEQAASLAAGEAGMAGGVAGEGIDGDRSKDGPGRWDRRRPAIKGGSNDIRAVTGNGFQP